MVTGSQAASAYGEHVAAELAGDLANRERVLVAGGAYGVEAAVHRAVLAAGGGHDRRARGCGGPPHPSGHHELLDRMGDGVHWSVRPPSGTDAASVPDPFPTAGGHVSGNGGRCGRRAIGGHCEWQLKPTRSDARLVQRQGRSPAPPAMGRTCCPAPAMRTWSSRLLPSKNSPPSAPPNIRTCRSNSHVTRRRWLHRRIDRCSRSAAGEGIAPSVSSVRCPILSAPVITGRVTALPAWRAAEARFRWLGGSGFAVLFRLGHGRSSAPCPRDG